jgi:hypothetical protein
MKPYHEHNLKLWTYYVVRVSMRPGNPPWLAILYTGSHAGGYRQLFSGSIDLPCELESRTVFEVISEITDMNEKETE